MDTVKIIGLLAISLLLASCKTVVLEGQKMSKQVPYQGSTMQFNSVGFADTHLVNKIAVERTSWRKTPTGTVECYATLKNRTSYQQILEVQAIFYDEYQAPLGQPTAWEKVFLSPQSFVNYRGLSTDTDAAYYYIQVREAN